MAIAAPTRGTTTATTMTTRLTRLVPDRTVPTGGDELWVLTWRSTCSDPTGAHVVGVTRGATAWNAARRSASSSTSRSTSAVEPLERLQLDAPVLVPPASRRPHRRPERRPPSRRSLRREHARPVLLRQNPRPPRVHEEHRVPRGEEPHGRRRVRLRKRGARQISSSSLPCSSRKGRNGSLRSEDGNRASPSGTLHRAPRGRSSDAGPKPPRYRRTSSSILSSPPRQPRAAPPTLPRARTCCARRRLHVPEGGTDRDRASAENPHRLAAREVVRAGTPRSRPGSVPPPAREGTSRATACEGVHVHVETRSRSCASTTPGRTRGSPPRKPVVAAGDHVDRLAHQCALDTERRSSARVRSLRRKPSRPAQSRM